MKILHLYPDFMNLYGEYGNMRVLQRHLQDQGVTVTLEEKTVTDDSLDFSDVDFIYIGCGTERSQKAALQQFCCRTVRPFWMPANGALWAYLPVMPATC